MTDAINEMEVYQQSLLEAKRGGDLKDIGQAKVNLGMAMFLAGKIDDALKIIDEAIGIARQEHDANNLASYLGKRGVILFEIKEFVKAQECFLSVLDLAEKAGNHAFKCDALGNLGLILASTGNPTGSMEKLNEALTIARQMGDPSRELTQLGNIGHTYLQVANIDDAIKCYSLAVQIAIKIGDRKSEAGYLNNLGVIYHNISQLDPLIKTFDQVLIISKEIGDRNLAFNALQHLARAMSVNGDTDRAIQYSRQALDILNELQSSIDQNPIKDILITNLIREKRYTEAIDEIHKNLEEVRLHQNNNRELTLLGQLADTFFQVGELGQSKGVYQHALDLSVRLQSKLLEGRIAGRLGALYADLGEYEQSNQYIERAIRLAESEKDLQTLAEQYFLRALNNQEMGQLNKTCSDCYNSIDLFKRIGLIAQAQQIQDFLAKLQKIQSPNEGHGNKNL